jgi:hypothetical protein
MKTGWFQELPELTSIKTSSKINAMKAKKTFR